MVKYFDELESNKNIKVYDWDLELVENYPLPNCYYINPKNILYNGMGEEGHKGANLIYLFRKIDDYFNKVKYLDINGFYTISLEKILKSELEKYEQIILTNCVTEGMVHEYLHLRTDNNNPIVKDLILGIISSNIIVLEKFLELNKKGYDYIMKKTNGYISDILVRYCDFHKIASNQPKTIITSSFDFNSFMDYLCKGWKIINVSKIIGDESLPYLAYDNFLEKNPEYEKQIKLER